MATTVAQLSANPTNKLSAATIASAIVALANAIVSKYWPEYADPTIWAAIYPLAGFIAGYMTRDKANVAVVPAENVVKPDA